LRIELILICSTRVTFQTYEMTIDRNVGSNLLQISIFADYAESGPSIKRILPRLRM